MFLPKMNASKHIAPIRKFIRIPNQTIIGPRDRLLRVANPSSTSPFFTPSRLSPPSRSRMQTQAKRELVRNRESGQPLLQQRRCRRALRGLSHEPVERRGYVQPGSVFCGSGSVSDTELRVTMTLQACFGEGAAGSRFQICFESDSTLLNGKGNVGLDPPRAEL